MSLCSLVYITQTDCHNMYSLPSWYSNESLSRIITSYEKRIFGFPTFTPLNSTEMEKGFKGSGSFSKTDPRPWISLFDKLVNKQDINIHVFGGSSTDGNGCKGRSKALYYDRKKRCSWHYR